MAYGDPGGSPKETMRLTDQRDRSSVVVEGDPEFAADCLAATKQAAAAHLRAPSGRLNGLEAGPRVPDSESEHVLGDADTRPNPADQADLQGIIRGLKAHIEELRKALTESQAQNKASSATARENEALRQALTHAREQRSADANAIQDLVRQVASAQSELVMVGQTLSATTGEHRVDLADLKEARRREGKVRDELATAMTAISGHDAKVDQLRQIITSRDLEIVELRQRLLEAEEARAADAAAFLDSLTERRV